MPYEPFTNVSWTSYKCLITICAGVTFRNENNSFRNVFIQWSVLLDKTRLNIQHKVVRREQDSRETDREREKKRERKRECVCVLLQIGGGVGNKFVRWRKFLRWIETDNLRSLRWPLWLFFQTKIFSLLFASDFLSNWQVTNTAQNILRTSF